MRTPLDNSPETAYRLNMADDNTVKVSRMLSTWTLLSDEKRQLSDLPDTMRRNGEHIVCDEDLEPINLDEDETILEAFRISNTHRPPNADGWHRLSNVARVAGALRRTSEPPAIGKRDKHYKKSGDLVRSHPAVETKNVGNALYVRLNPAGPMKSLPPVTSTVAWPNDPISAQLPDAATMGEAYRQVHEMTNKLVPKGTKVTFTRGDELCSATYDNCSRFWTMDDGTVMKRIAPSDPVLHSYTNGHLVGGLVGFVSISKSGRAYANIGKPIHSKGDDDAHINVTQLQEFDTFEDALRALKACEDLDRVFTAEHSFVPMMGFWLSCLKDDEA